MVLGFFVPESNQLFLNLLIHAILKLLCLQIACITFSFLMIWKIKIKSPYSPVQNNLQQRVYVYLTCREFNTVNIHANALDAWLTARTPNTQVMPSRGSNITVALSTVLHLNKTKSNIHNNALLFQGNGKQFR